MILLAFSLVSVEKVLNYYYYYFKLLLLVIICLGYRKYKNYIRYINTNLVEVVIEYLNMS